MVLGGLAHDEGVKPQAARRGGVEHGGGHRIRPHGQTPDRIDVIRAQTGLLEHVEHDVADERSGAAVQGRSAHIDVEIGFDAGGQGDPAAHDGEVGDELGEAGALGVVRCHATRLDDRSARRREVRTPATATVRLTPQQVARNGSHRPISTILKTTTVRVARPTRTTVTSSDQAQSGSVRPDQDRAATAAS